VAIVRAKRLLGEKYLQLDPGELEGPALADGATIEHVRTTFEIDELLNALEPILGGDSSIGAAIGPLAQRLDGLLASAAGEDGQPPVLDREQLRATVADAQATVASVRRFAETNEQALGELVTNTNALLSDPRLDRILTNLDRSSAALEQRLPGLLDRADDALAGLDALGKELTPERAAKIGVAIDDLAVVAGDLREISGQMKGLSGDVAPLVSSLTEVAQRAAAIDELVVRRFLQEEGIRVRLSGREAKRRNADLDDEP
jgi:ABC-type transporter Mla subunit MlaD